ncbi:hypothetical protein HRbin08_00912 [bacterium HR08]|nr:hypothetical protein HRbin08_00912 [bacterium HR08]
MTEIEGERVTNSAALPLDPLWGAAVVLGAAAFIRWGDAWVYHWAYRVSPPGMAGIVFVNLVSVAWYAWPVVFIVALLHGAKALGEELGLQQGGGPGVGYALLFTLPMSVGYALLGEVAKVAPSVLVVNQLRAAFREELFYRAFLFGQLFRRMRWGFVPAVGGNAVLFAVGHLYQASTLWEGIGVFAVAWIGAVWFAWLFVEWAYNLWLLIGLHFFMNLWWELFRVGEAAFSGMMLIESCRLLTVLASVGWTIWWRSRRGGLILRRRMLWRRRG